MKVGVITFPGSNCDRDLIRAWQSFDGVAVVNLWHKERDLQGCDLICIPGGFSYGDYLRSGAIARFAPVMQEVFAFAEKGGYVWGICNGFQILTECRLLPGALIRNQNTLFIHKDIWVKPESSLSPVSKSLNKDKAYQLPIAHAEGCFVCDDSTLKQLKDQDAVIFRYSLRDEQSRGDVNPNGSYERIAGICSPNGRVFAQMPHPERAMDPLGASLDGKPIFESILNSIK